MPTHRASGCLCRSRRRLDRKRARAVCDPHVSAECSPNTGEVAHRFDQRGDLISISNPLGSFTKSVVSRPDESRFSRTICAPLALKSIAT